MQRARKAGTFKSLAYVAMLTFFVPAGAFYLGNGLFTVSAEAGQTISHYVYPEVSTEHVVATCPNVNHDEII